MNKLNIIHVVDKEVKISKDIFETMAKSFEISYSEVNINNVTSIINEEKIHIVLFDNVDYHQISLDLTNALKEKFSHIHLVAISKRENELNEMRIYHRRIDNIWEASYSSEYHRTVFRGLLTRMSKRYIINKQVQFGDITIDRVLREVKFKDKFIDLTGKEYKIFHELVSRQGKGISKEELFKKVWGFDEDKTRTLDQYLHRIKKKTEDLGIKISSEKETGISISIKN